MISIIMGSRSDLPVMAEAGKVLRDLAVDFEIEIVSAHRTPDRMYTWTRDAEARGIAVIIAGAGGAAHLPGMVASLTTLPVVGVPVKSRNSLDGWDSLLSIVQMPGGIPVACVAVDNARNAGLLAAQMLAVHDPQLRIRLQQFRTHLREKVEADASRVGSTVFEELLREIEG